jgi:hypothetical protein
VFQNGELRIIFGPKAEEITGRWRKLHKGKLHNLYFSPNIIGMINQGIKNGTRSTDGRDERYMQNFSRKT